jgi:hypothetical protein
MSPEQFAPKVRNPRDAIAEKIAIEIPNELETTVL